MLAVYLVSMVLVAVIEFATDLGRADILLEFGEGRLWLNIALLDEKRLFLHVCHGEESRRMMLVGIDVCEGVRVAVA